MATREEELKQRPVIGSGFSGVDSFLNRPLADTLGISGAVSGLRGALANPAPTGFGFSQSPFATNQYSGGASTPALTGFRSPFEGVSLIGRRDTAPPQFPTDGYDPSKRDTITQPPFQPRTTNSASMSQADAIAQSNTNMTDYQRRAYGLLSLSPSSAGVAMGAYQGAPTGIAGGVAPAAFSPSFDQGIASSRFGIAQSPNQTPMAPVSTNITGATERKGIQTAYGMIYPAAGQEAGAERSAALGPMGARYANVRQESNQADKIAQMRERGAAIGQSLVNRQEAYFAQKRAERGALGVAESAARTAGASSMDVMRARGAASGSASRFTESLPAGGFSSPRSGPMGLSGTDLYRQQQRDKMARGESGAFSNARSRQRRATRETARSQGLAPATNYSSQLDQEEYFRRKNLA